MPRLITRNNRLVVCLDALVIDSPACNELVCGGHCVRLFPSDVCGTLSPDDCGEVHAPRWWCEGVVCSTSGLTLGQLADSNVPSIVLVDNGICHAVDLGRCGFLPTGAADEPESPFPPDDAPTVPGGPCGPIPMDPPPVVVFAGAFECHGSCAEANCGAVGYIYGDPCDPAYSGPIPSVCAGQLIRDCFVVGLPREDTGVPACFEFRLGVGSPTPTTWDVTNILTPELQAGAAPSCCECPIHDCYFGPTLVPCTGEPGPPCCCGGEEFRRDATTRVTAYRFARFGNIQANGRGELQLELFYELIEPGDLVDRDCRFVLWSRTWINSLGVEDDPGAVLVSESFVPVASFIGCDGVGGGPLDAQFVIRCPADSCSGSSECLVGASVDARAYNTEGGICGAPVTGWVEQSWSTSISHGTPGDLCDPTTCRDAPQPLTAGGWAKRSGCASCGGGSETLTAEQLAELGDELG